MHQTKLCNWVFKGALALAIIAGGVSNAFAGWGYGGGSSGGSGGGWGGSSGGYSGGWGSSGGFGSSGGYGSSGGVARRGLFHHRARFGGSSGGFATGGSSGGWGSSGGNGFAGGSSGGWGSTGGWGSSGGAVIGGGYYSPSYSPSVIVPEGEVPMDAPVNPPPPPAGDVDAADAPPATDGAMLRRADGTLVVEVPADAKIYVNDRLTSTPGEIREYVSRNLVRGYNYSYEVRAEIERDGKTISETKKIDLRAGQHAKVAFNLTPASDDVETSITVKVPANAKVNLGGNDTNAKGETRVFRTSALRNGGEWKDYKIVVTAEVDGREITKEQTFDLKAGENKELNFDFDAASIADAR